MFILRWFFYSNFLPSFIEIYLDQCMNRQRKIFIVDVILKKIAQLKKLHLNDGLMQIVEKNLV